MQLRNLHLVKLITRTFKLQGLNEEIEVDSVIVPTISLSPYVSDSLSISADITGTTSVTADPAKGTFVSDYLVVTNVNTSLVDAPEHYLTIDTEEKDAVVCHYQAFWTGIATNNTFMLPLRTRMKKGGSLTSVMSYAAGSARRRIVLVGHYEE